MCGIIGYAGPRPALPVLLDGLKRLEYRGYDSSGVAILDSEGGLFLHKDAGKLADLLAGLGDPPEGLVGFGHTRWATHGKPTLVNAHPHTDCTGGVAVAHNGIVENHRQLREELEAEGHIFLSKTDTEVIPHLIEERLARGATLEEAIRHAVGRLAGAQAIVALSRQEPDRIVGVRIGHAGGMAVGYGEDELLLASDLPAMVTRAKSVTYLAGGEMAVITRHKAEVTTLEGSRVSRKRQPVTDDGASAVKGQYRHFMLKEIMEQPESLMGALSDRMDLERMQVTLPGFPYTAKQVNALERVVIIGMGTSYHSALVGREMIETMSRIPTQAENASEFRYRDPVIDSKTLVISVCQSGETVDTLAAMVEAKARGAPQITICNVPGSETTRLADYTLYINAGPEIAVASTKTLTGSIVCLYLLAIFLGQLRGTLDQSALQDILGEVAHLPKIVGDVVDRGPHYEALARKYFHATGILVLGRGVHYPVALEGALKLKEISYIHAEGYPAGEMKHGPISLVDENLPVVTIALKDKLNDKMLGTIEEIKARDGKVIVVATEGDDATAHAGHDVITVPGISYLLSPILVLAALQLLAYYIAVRRGCDVDQPRNLAKTVTVE